MLHASVYFAATPEPRLRLLGSCRRAKRHGCTGVRVCVWSVYTCECVGVACMCVCLFVCKASESDAQCHCEFMLKTILSLLLSTRMRA